LNQITHPELDQFERQEKLRLWRNWALLAALIACFVAVSTFWVAAGNPKTWASAYDALATAGALTWLALPLLAVGGVLLLVGLIFTVLLRIRQ
jgi:hypothetical protein